MDVPFLDLKAQYAGIRAEVSEALEAVVDAAAFAGGPFVERFEKEFAAYCGAQHAIGVGSGTEALWLSLLALGVGPGDEVITVPNTFIATAEAISACGARPVFVDVDESTLTLDPAKLERAITGKSKGILPVHLHGQTADLKPIMTLAAERDLFVLEDACQAHGAEYEGRKAGTIGQAGCFSFYPGKNLGACGEAGAVVTDDDSLAERIRRLRDHGQARKYYHAEVGWNARMDGMQAAVLSVKLKRLDAWNRCRSRHAEHYAMRLGDLEALTLPAKADYGTHVWHIYAIRVPRRDGLLAALQSEGIQCGIHYPVPIHLQEAYRALGLGRGSYPVAEESAGHTLSLPMFPELTAEQVDHVCDHIRKHVA